MLFLLFFFTFVFMKSKLFSEKAERTQISTGRWVRILPDKGEGYQMYDALGEYYIGRILFDANGFWIYDGGVLSVNEQEDVTGYINSYYPEMDNLLKSLEYSMEQLCFFPEAGMSKGAAGRDAGIYAGFDR